MKFQNLRKKNPNCFQRGQREKKKKGIGIRMVSNISECWDLKDNGENNFQSRILYSGKI